MKKMLLIGAMAILALALATPASAGHGGPKRGHKAFVERHGRHDVGVSRSYYHYRPRPRSFVSFGFGFPAYGYYSPSPVYYAPPRAFYGPPPCDVWVPGGYAWNGGVRIWIGGHWSR